MALPVPFVQVSLICVYPVFQKTLPTRRSNFNQKLSSMGNQVR